MTDRPVWLMDDDYDEEGNLDVEWYPIPPGLLDTSKSGIFFDLEKATRGFSRGLERASHKYWKRVRYMSSTGPKWRYYYDNEKDRKRFVADIEKRKEVTRAKRKEKYWETKAKGDHRSKAQFERDFPQLREARKALTQLSAQYIQDLLGWETPPKIQISKKASAAFHQNVVDHYGDQDPDELHGLPVSAYRSLELAIQRLPATIKDHFEGSFGNIKLALTSEDPLLRDRSALGYTRGKDLVIDLQKCQKFAMGRGDHMKGGMLTTEVILHEVGHAVLASMEKNPPKGMEDLFESWKKFYQETGISEPAITGYAEESMDPELRMEERFAESFAATLMYPQEMAMTAPKMYAWMRDFLGHDVVPPLTMQPTPGFPPPLRSDQQELARLKKAYESAVKAKEDQEVLRLSKKIDHYRDGVVQMHEDDARLKWWRAPETKVQRLLSQAPQAEYAGNVYQHPDDKFYEMNVGGRSLFMRVGKRDSRTPFSGWRPDKVGSRPWEIGKAGGLRYQLKNAEIKEIYDENGKPLTWQTATWHLMQDKWGDESQESIDLAGFEVSKSITKEQHAVLDKTELPRLLGNNADRAMKVKHWKKALAEAKTDKARAAAEKRLQAAEKSLKAVAAQVPVELDEKDFRLRSGTFTFDGWEVGGENLVSQISKMTAGSPERIKLESEYLRQQPNTAWKAIRDAKGRVIRRQPIIDFNDSGKASMRHQTKIFRTPNPDGTYTKIEVERETEGPRAGEFFISNPVWRALLTPNGEAIRKAEDLKRLCMDAARSRRRSWIAVRTRTRNGAEPHYIHLQVEFDGRGSPLIVGDEWKRRLGYSEPRLEDLLKTRPDGSAALEAEAIKVDRPKKVRGRKLLKNLKEIMEKGDGPARAVLQTDEGQVLVDLIQILPVKRAGEEPSPPGWDRMPDNVTDGLPHPGDDQPALKLRSRESDLINRGLLPPWYTGTKQQRDWLRRAFEPAYAQWDASKALMSRKSLPERYVFIDSTGNRIIRYGAKSAADDLEDVHHAGVPRSLQHDTLIYMHKEINPVNGDVQHEELRMLLPEDGSLTLDSIAGLPGVKIYSDGKIGVSLNGFARLRHVLGAVSITEDVRRKVTGRADELERAQEELAATHEIDIRELDRENLDKTGKLRVGQLKGVGLNANVGGDGPPFTLPEHQVNLVQKAVDQHGRIGAAHFMGTGKTVSAIVVAKLMMSEFYEKKTGEKGPKRTLVLAPLNTVTQWDEAGDLFDDGITVIGAGKGMISIEKYIKSGAQDDMLVCGPEYFTLHEKEFKKLVDGLIQDEAHRGSKSEKADLNKIIKKWEPDMKLLMLMTGTPMTTSPADMLEYIKILSGGEIWGDMTRRQWIDRYLEESTVAQDLGILGLEGSKLAIKPSMYGELASIIGKYFDVALPKDVRGKMMPATRIEETEYAEMVGVQALLYASKMGGLSEQDRVRLSANARVLAKDEVSGLSDAGTKAVRQAKAIANCPAYKAASVDPWVTVTREVPTVNAEGETVMQSQDVDWETFHPQWLLDRPDIRNTRMRERMAGRWPTIEEIGLQGVAHYNLHFQKVLKNLGVDSYEQLAGTRVREDQLKVIGNKKGKTWQRSRRWPERVANEEAGPVGIRCRGTDDVKPTDSVELQKATNVQRDYAEVLRGVSPGDWEEPVAQNVMQAKTTTKIGKKAVVDKDAALKFVADHHKISVDEARHLLGVRPTTSVHTSTVRYGSVTVEEGETWAADKRGSQQLLYRMQDWDSKSNRPKSGGPFSTVKDGDLVDVAADVVRKMRPKPGRRPKDMTAAAWEGEKKKIEAEWIEPTFRYDKSTPAKAKNSVTLINTDTGDTLEVLKSKINSRVSSLMDPGMREERRKADVAMVVGNAKAEQLISHIERFHEGTQGGPDGERQMVMFGKGILESCRVMEATMRIMGFKDVNEALEGSKEFDPEDDHPGNGKYFVTYIGSTYTGDRDLNSEIFKKRKDKRDRDLKQSMFTYRCTEGKGWKPIPGGSKHADIEVSRWTPGLRDKITKQFKIRTPEAYFVGDDGNQRYFYGTSESAKIRQQMIDLGDPRKMPEAKKAEVIAKLEKMTDRYEKIVKAGGVTDPPLTRRQESVFNNCEMIVCSDAAQVGLNFGNAVEMKNYDSLASPMAEMQRVARSARMLPPSIEEDLITRKDGSDGPIGKLMKLERANTIFAPVATRNVGGMIRGVAIDGGPAGGEVSFRTALYQISEHARGESASGSKANAAAWNAIAARAEVASNLGVNQARAEFNALRGTKAPGATHNVISYDRISKFTDPMEGTYGGEVSVLEPINAVRDMIENTLTVKEIKELTGAGFNKVGGKPSVIDPASVYMAIRSQQIMDFINAQHDKVYAEMKTRAGGSVVQEMDVMNTIIDSLHPNDRAVLKTQKYLVNVQRMGVSGVVPQFVDVPVAKGADASGKPIVETERVFVGHENQYPVSTEANVRALGRGRATAIEALLKAVQEQTTIRVELDINTAGAQDIETMSSIIKSMDTFLLAIEETGWQIDLYL